jgi:hypothetical protein
MFNFHTIFMPTDPPTNHKPFTVHQRVIVNIKLPTPRLTRLTKPITNRLSRAHTTTKTQTVFPLPFIKWNEAHLPAPNANYLLLVHTKTLAVPK